MAVQGKWHAGVAAVLLLAATALGQAVAQDAALSDAEAAAVRQSIGRYWNVTGVCNLDAPVRVTVSVALDRSGIPQSGSVTLLESVGPSEAAIEQAFATARRTILRAGAAGLPLQAQNYDAWKDMELTFGCGELLVG